MVVDVPPFCRKRIDFRFESRSTMFCCSFLHRGSLFFERTGNWFRATIAVLEPAYSLPSFPESTGIREAHVFGDDLNRNLLFTRWNGVLRAIKAPPNLWKPFFPRCTSRHPFWASLVLWATGQAELPKRQGCFRA